jgi:hypothetical protein
MFIRAKEVKGELYYQMVESFRDGGKVRHRTIMSLGQSATIAKAIESSKREVTQLKRRLNGMNLQPGWQHEFSGELGRSIDGMKRQLKRHEERLVKLLEVAARYDLETKKDAAAAKERSGSPRLLTAAEREALAEDAERHRAARAPTICGWCAKPITHGGHVAFRNESYHYGDCEILAKRARAK